MTGCSDGGSRSLVSVWGRHVVILTRFRMRLLLYSGWPGKSLAVRDFIMWEEVDDVR